MKRNSTLLSGSDAVLEHRSISRDLPEIGTKLYEPSSSWLEGNRLRNALQERHALICQPRIERDCVLCVGKWEAETKRVVVLKKRGKELETFGHHDSQCSSTYILNPEEALFLVESNSLTLLNEDVEMSLEMCYALLLEGGEDGCSLLQYRVFSNLSRLGYKLIRHKKPTIKESTPSAPQPASREKELSNVASASTVQGNDCAKVNEENIVVIEDSSSDDDDDIVIVDVIKKSLDKEVIQIEDDDDTCDSDIVILENEGLEELPLDDWSYVHRSKFLSQEQTENSIVRVDPLIIAQSEYEIFNEIPNIKGHKSWLFRADEHLLPHGVWPFHYKYLIDPSEQKGWNNRGRGGFRGYRGFRGRGYYLQRQVSQMKNYTLSLMNMVSQIMGGQGLQVIPPPPNLFHGPNYRDQRGQRGRVSWGRISFGSRGSFRGNFNNDSVSEMVVLSDDEEETEGNKRIIKTESSDEDVKPKRLKLEADINSIDSNNSNLIKIESSSIKQESNIKRENNFVDTEKVFVKTENQVKMETDDNMQTQNESSNISSVTNIEAPILEREPCSIVSASSNDDSHSLGNNASSNPVNESESKDSTRHYQESSSMLSNCSQKSKTQVENSCESPVDTDQQDNVQKSASRTEFPTSSEFCLEQSNSAESLSNSKTPCIAPNVDDFIQSSTSVNIIAKKCNQTEGVCNSSDKSENLEGSLSDAPISSTSNETINQSSTSVNVIAKKFNQTEGQCVLTDKCENLEGSLSEAPSSSLNESNEQISTSDNTIVEKYVKTYSFSPRNLSEGTLVNTEDGNITDMPSQNISTDSLSNRNIEQMDSHDDDVDSRKVSHQDKNGKKRCWKELKVCDPLIAVSEEENCSTKEPVEEIEVDSQDDYVTSLIEPHHCSSLDEVLKRLNIIKEFTSKKIFDPEKDLLITVKYDVYLPTSTYYRNLPPSPDLRLIILRPEDPLPDANQLTLLKQIYNDNKNFLFAVVLPESIAYYLYDTVYLPVDNETL